MSKFTLKLFASLSEHLPAGAKDNAIVLNLAEDATIGGALAALGVPREQCHLVLLNGIFVPPGQRQAKPISEGDVVSVWPPVAGG